MINSNKCGFTIDLGLQPVSNRFYPLESGSSAPKFHLGLKVNPKTGLIELNKLFPVEELKPRHDWLTNFEPEDHLDKLVEDLINLPGVSRSSVIGAYSFKDDTTIKRLNTKGYNNSWRIDPESDLGVDKFANLETYQHEFTIEKSRKIKKKYGEADILLVRHALEHAYDISNFVKAIRLLVKPTGFIVWELPSCEKYLIHGDCTMIWEEHIYYFTEFTFREFFKKEKLFINNLNLIQYPLEDCIVAITHEKQNLDIDNFNDNKDIDIEIEINRAKKYIELLSNNKVSIPKILEDATNKFGNIVIFGAGHFTAAFISILNIEHLIDYIIDENPNKKGRKFPAGNIPIVSPDILQQNNIKLCFLGSNPQSHHKIIDKNKDFVDSGGIFLSIFPGTDRYFEDIL
tara:strand:+ start:866 stop:2068 length:1203 start_codon:yes stop_codon:yes gene_type:complete